MSKIEWTDATLNCVTGCTKISTGCRNCYAERMTKRLQGMGIKKYAAGFDKVVCHPEVLDQIAKWRKPRRVFINSMSDTFHKDVGLGFIDAIMNACIANPQHQFQILTKRAGQLRFIEGWHEWPDNVWMGVTVENDLNRKRIAHLSYTDAKIKFVSFEPLVGIVGHVNLLHIDWAIIGCETGPGRRPMKDEWVERLIENCREYDVPVFYKQQMVDGKKVSCPEILGRQWMEYPEARA